LSRGSDPLAKLAAASLEDFNYGLGGRYIRRGEGEFAEFVEVKKRKIYKKREGRERWKNVTNRETGKCETEERFGNEYGQK
jgi:hypothetical protein